ncbi:MAG: hypothetical protein EPO01_19860 [Aquabacterium sp.]|nr:MAG: hypothetical protein EPO01_19860 [Aquabacterium sp.]
MRRHALHQSNTIGRALAVSARALALSAAIPLAASAATSYYKWEAVELPASSGASCGNGTPYRFFVNRTPFSSKTVVIFEGGGACWAQNSCQGKGGILTASNPNGVPASYMSGINLAVFGLVTPFSSRIHPLQSVQTQSWNIVYAPYCTGDVHTGNKVAIYSDADATKPLTYYHRGGVNGEKMAEWLGKNLVRPDNLLVTGFSAGGAGATANYGWLRLALNPKKSALLADAGPLFNVNRNDTPQQSPSVLLHNKIRSAWGLDGPEGLVTKLLTRYPDAGTADNLGSLNTGLSKIFPQDRLGFAVFQQDGIYSAFSYTDFYPEIAATPSGAQRDALLNAKWRQDIANWLPQLQSRSNIGYYIPYSRDLLKAHCLTIATFGGTAIKEANLKNVGAFVDNLIDGTGTPIRSFETQRNTQNTPLGPLDSLLQPVYEILGL